MSQGGPRPGNPAAVRGRKPGDRWRKAARNAAIRAEFNGANYGELATRWRLSERMIRHIVDRPPKK